MDKFYLENHSHKKILRKFLQLNSLKLQRTKSSLKQRQGIFYNYCRYYSILITPLYPVLFLPNVLQAFLNTTPPRTVSTAPKKIALSFDYKRRAYRQYDILALYFMGSTGTIAYSDKSDFDIWVCHREDLSAIELKELQLKTERISQWCTEFNLEANFFLIHTEQFRAGKIENLSSESSGTSQHLFLLEEFYRTSMLLEGRYPIWWLVPEFEQVYDEYVENIMISTTFEDSF
ncbi:hypothetical protein [sulfur-oxidizing endosymbiont of Gigantopelta aegis]|uniref:hypothetical protein n=1 Tax=sulfur-oxidizing endosymbiont of Gigantopelta aegis TaxID=2794934 RepID=UPI0018DDBDC5|nr:hypothetical protein [sulfur-oxidizing endosymbiont of Gigantopelta aegis]